MERELKDRICNAIKTLKLKKKQLDIITLGNLEKIQELANCRLDDVMWYLRCERK